MKVRIALLSGVVIGVSIFICGCSSSTTETNKESEQQEVIDDSELDATEQKEDSTDDSGVTIHKTEESEKTETEPEEPYEYNPDDESNREYWSSFVLDSDAWKNLDTYEYLTYRQLFLESGYYTDIDCGIQENNLIIFTCTLQDGRVDTYKFLKPQDRDIITLLGINTTDKKGYTRDIDANETEQRLFLTDIANIYYENNN
ncbi:hypothetical protein [Terrisporobacter hibernicus]|uniref:Uncharacterized protein n=1 Tax=Terrisporobacter hibernicus TaxID=2813371 RepID=A0AAX2ZFV6_9FIRM|nr:hypothetical protein [Terrisporobacter hibernicus]UEL48218.1 hypothetical protein JW646_01845 [Terrisporobacter hibernicus]